MTKIIFINGPPRSGKDTAGEILRDQLGGELFKFAHALKVGTHALFTVMQGRYGVDNPEFYDDSYYEATKDQSEADMYGITPRAAYIAVSEQLCKPLFGEQFFGRVLRDTIVRREPSTAIITDSGFGHEAVPIVERFGAENCLLIRMWRDRCNFSKDSRNYISLPGIETIDVHNDYSIDSLRVYFAKHAVLNR